MKAVVSVVLIVLAIIIGVKLLGLAFKLVGILIVVGLCLGGYVVAKRMLKGPSGA